MRQMEIKPILFNTEMVRAILDGRKSCTRRVVKFPVNRYTNNVPLADKMILQELRCDKAIFLEEPFFSFGMNLPYQPGDILYVRETWHKYTKRVGEGENCHLAEFYGYKASVANSEDAGEPWKPSIHMPKEAARIWLKVTDVRVERLQEIDEDGVWDEGFRFKPSCLTRVSADGRTCDLDGPCTSSIKYCDMTMGELFGRELWNNTIKKSDMDRYGWDANPWVWVIEFERCEKPEGV